VNASGAPVTTPREVHIQLVEGRGNLEGRFTAIRRLGLNGGNGHFSLVFIADDNVTQQEAVLKVFNPERRTPTEAYRWGCFERESRVLARLVGEKDIVQLISGQAEFVESVSTSIPGLSYDIRFTYYAMEKADSDVAAAILDQIWGPADCLKAFHCMVRSVQRVHALRLAHCDLKPDNFLITNSGIKLSDFGCARFLDGTDPPLLNAYDFPRGDFRYSSPELFACLHDVKPEIAFRADIFALGAILFEMFTGVILGIQLFGPGMLTDLTVHMGPIVRGQRIDIYHQIVGDIARAHPLPDISSLNPLVKPAIRDQVDRLYKSMCAIDYSNRNCHFPSIFRQIDTCLLILKNEASYQRWQAERQRRRAIRLTRKGSFQ
jgi:serine/threonine protein kinase